MSQEKLEKLRAMRAESKRWRRKYGADSLAHHNMEWRIRSFIAAEKAERA